MIRWEDEPHAWVAYLGNQPIAEVCEYPVRLGWAPMPHWHPVGIIAKGHHEYGQHASATIAEAKQAVEDYVQSWLQDAGLVSAPWLRASVAAYWEKRGGVPRLGGVA
ncbi:hypothetical protein OS035_24425 [Rhizobium sp. 268]|uniref:hypothetical protein n=1 Tax=Rhizobium sp. 268 TaxID=2996375 RepID=UPI002F93371F